MNFDQMGLSALDLLYAAAAAPSTLDCLELRPEEALLDPLLYASRRLNINHATVEEVASLPGLSLLRATQIVKFVKEHGPIASLEVLLPETAELLAPWVRLGHSAHEPQFYQRINLNSDSLERLMLLPGIGRPWALAIIAHRPWATVEQLTKLPAFPHSLLDRIRPWATTATESQAYWTIDSAPGRGTETELEQRVKYFVREEYALSAERVIELELWKAERTTYSFGHAIQLAQETLRALGAAGSYLRPDVFEPPGAEVLPQSPPPPAAASSFSVADVAELQARVKRALIQACKLIVALGGDPIHGPDDVPLCDPGPPPTRDAILAGLQQAARYGVPNAIPSGPEDPALEQVQARTRASLGARARSCVQRMNRSAQAAGDASGTQVAELVEALKVLFGAAFIVLPTFTSSRAPELAQAFAQRHLKAGDQAQRVQVWLQQAGQTQPALAGLDDLQLATHLWRQSTDAGTTPALSYHVAQLPYRGDRSWLALDDAERANSVGTEDREAVLSIVAAVGGDSPLADAAQTTRFAGLLLDHWTETIPTGNVDTSIAFHYDAPNQRAPQALLLAVPRERRPTPQAWTTADLVAIVRDTADLAKVRAVDSDAMADVAPDDVVDTELPSTPGVGLVFPALLFPVDPNKPDWAWDGVTGSINDMVEVLETEQPLVTAGTLRFLARQAFLEATPEPTLTWRIAEPGESDAYTLHAYARGLSEEALNGAILRQVKARSTTVTDRLYVIEYAVETYPAAFGDSITVEGKLTQSGAEATAQLDLTAETTTYQLQGSAVFEGHNLAKSAASVTLRVHGHLLNGSPANKLWIDAYEILDLAEAGPPALIGTVLKLTAVTPEEFYLRADDGTELFLDGDYDPSAMLARFGDRIWVQGEVGNRAGSDDEPGPPNITVTAFGLVRGHQDMIQARQT